MILQHCIECIKDGRDITFDQALELAITTDSAQLFEAADHIRRHLHGDSFDLCSIINAKSGKCTEDCRFCAQSSHYDADIMTYDVIDIDEAVVQARDNDAHDVERLSLVTAGRSSSLQDIEQFGRIYAKLSELTDLRYCASMGMLTLEKAKMLKSYGVERYHCNLEACRSYFPEVCTTHTWEEKVETIKIARQAGLDVCSGGIFGMGETLEHRLELAFELQQLEVNSIPINILTPIANTPFENFTPLSLAEVLRSIALFRFINPRAVVRLAGGRNQLGDQQYSCFTSGANGAIVGNYLTTAGNALADDLKAIENSGFRLARKKK
jgi:biotin synthase